MRRVMALAALVTTMLAFAPATAAHAADPGAEAAMTGSVNTLRQSRGLPPLGTHPVLTAKAQGWAAYMAASGTLSHSSLSSGISVPWSKLGENVGYGPNVGSIFSAFVNSPPHFANMVDGTFRWIGVGVAYGGGRMWVAVEFMNGAAPPAPPPPPPAPPARVTATTPSGGFYVLKANGNVRAYNGAQSYGQANYPVNIARGFAAMPDGRGYAILDGWGGVHLYGSARSLPRAPFYWKGWDIARGIAISRDGRGYAVVDGWGGVHTMGTAPRLGPASFRGLDIARGIAISPDNRGIYVLDGWGGVHVKGTARSHGSPYWRGWDIARAISLTADGNGYAVLDGYGGVHSSGNAPRASGVPYIHWDVWRGLASVPGGYIVTRADGYSVKA